MILLCRDYPYISHFLPHCLTISTCLFLALNSFLFLPTEYRVVVASQLHLIHYFFKQPAQPWLLTQYWLTRVSEALLRGCGHWQREDGWCRWPAAPRACWRVPLPLWGGGICTWSKAVSHKWPWMESLAKEISGLSLSLIASGRVLISSLVSTWGFSEEGD